jgi:hypothetical protein
MTEEPRRRRWPLIALLGGVVLVVVIALIAVFTRGGPAEYPADTPEGVVQRYSQAVIDGDLTTAREYLVPDLADSCERVEPGADDYRITLVDTQGRDDTARVEVIVSTISGSGPLGPNEYESDEVFLLEKVGGSWLISSAPWQVTFCYGLE